MWSNINFEQFHILRYFHKLVGVWSYVYIYVLFISYEVNVYITFDYDHDFDHCAIVSIWVWKTIVWVFLFVLPETISLSKLEDFSCSCKHVRV